MKKEEGMEVVKVIIYLLKQNIKMKLYKKSIYNKNSY